MDEATQESDGSYTNYRGQADGVEEIAWQRE